MVILKTKVKLIDNSGVELGETIKILKKKQVGLLGDFIILIVKKLSYKRLGLKKKKLIKQGDLYKAIIVQTKKQQKRFDGSFIKFDNNSVVLLNNQLLPIGTRISGLIANEILFIKDNKKLVSLASVII